MPASSKILGALALALALPLAAHAAVFTFDDQTVPFHTAADVPAGYAGANFDGFILRRTGELQYTGLNSNDVSQIEALGVVPDPSITFLHPTTLLGFFLINPRGPISFDLYLGSTLVGSSGDLGILARFEPSPYTGPVDRVVFHQNVGGQYAFGLDDIDAHDAPAGNVPEPSTLALAGLSLGLIILRRRSLEARGPLPGGAGGPSR